MLPRSNSLLGLSLGYSAATFLVPQILAHEDALVNGRVFIFTSTTSTITSYRILITEEYKNAHFFSVFLFVSGLCVILCRFSQTRLKLGIVRFILRHPVRLGMCASARVCSGRYGARGVATGWTGVDMSTPLLLQVAPEIDTNPTSYYRGRGGRSG